MRIRLSSRLAFIGAATVVLATAGVARLPATPTFASPLHSLTAGDFHEVALQGFGDSQNSWAWSMAWFNNKLYVGTNRAYICTVAATFYHSLPWAVYPPAADPNLAVQCNPNPQALPEAAEIWALDPSSATGALTQSNWTRVYQSPYNVAVSISHTSAMTMAPRDIGFRGMSVFNDPEGTTSLYVSGVGSKPLNGKNVPPPSLLRTTDGSTFQAVPADPGTTMGDINTLPTLPNISGRGPAGTNGCCMRGQVSMDGYFIVNIGSIQGGGALFSSTDPAQGDNSFHQITPPTMQVYEMVPFNGHLYVGVESYSGYQVYRTDCLTPPPGKSYCPKSAFKQVVPNGGGLGSQGNGGITSMHVFTDTSGVPHLYVGGDGTDDTSVPQAAELIRVNSDDTWDLIMGQPRTVNKTLMTPLSGLTAGFGWSQNVHMWRMEDYNGVLYVGTNDASTLYAGTPQGQSMLPWMGFDLWASADGVTFLPVTQNGFGDMWSYGARSIEATPYGLFIGSANHYQGLRIWQGSVSQTAISQSPKGAQGETTDNHGTVALSWDAPSNATVYHVYRSTYSRLALPRPHHLDATSSIALASRMTSASVPGTFSEIGLVTSPAFVDHTARKGRQYRYYVVAQDANGNLSAPSNVVQMPSPAQPASFGYLRAVVTRLLKHHNLTSEQANQVRQALSTARTDVRSGNVQGARDAIQGLRQALMSGAPGVGSRSRIENLVLLLGRLERRFALVDSHIVSAAHLG